VDYNHNNSRSMGEDFAESTFDTVHGLLYLEALPSCRHLEKFSCWKVVALRPSDVLVGGAVDLRHCGFRL